MGDISGHRALALFFKNANENEHFGEVGSFAVFPLSLLAKHKRRIECLENGVKDLKNALGGNVN